MRIISGRHKGINLDGFDIDGTRPTKDRVKESLFASINMYLKDALVLDLFAGSGSLGLEALSNGSRHVVFVENNQKMIDILNKNISKTKEQDNVGVLYQDYQDALEFFKKQNKQFDIIFLDPPYRLNLINDILVKIKEYNLLTSKGIIICEYENEIIANNDYECIKEKKYGKTNVKIYVNNV